MTVKLKKISKRSGGFRTVAIPDDKHKEECRKMLSHLQSVAIVLDVHNVQHGFRPGRSPVTNAKQHVGYEWTVSFDLKDCFDHVTMASVRQHIRIHWDLEQYAFVNDIAKQGLPTSPILANIAMSSLDNAIVGLLNGGGVYTRYADDLTISTNSRLMVDDLLKQIPGIVEHHGHEVNTRKTEVQWARNGRRIITGVAVDDKGIYPTRKMKRKLRAAEHQGLKWRANGIREWTKLKEPSVAQWVMDNATGSKSESTLAYLMAEELR